MATLSMAKMASWLTPLLRGQGSGETLTLMMTSSGHWERAKVIENKHAAEVPLFFCFVFQ